MVVAWKNYLAVILTSFIQDYLDFIGAIIVIILIGYLTKARKGTKQAFNKCYKKSSISNKLA